VVPTIPTAATANTAMTANIIVDFITMVGAKYCIRPLGECTIT
jgi:hypothetical protein